MTVLARCDSRAAVGLAVKAELARFGYSSSACAAVRPTPGGTSAEYLYRNWTADWTRYSAEQNFGGKSFAMPEARRRMQPFTWEDVAVGRDLSEGEAEVRNAARAFGWRNGIIVPIHGPGGYFAFLSMATAEDDVDPGAEANQRLAMIAYVSHQRCLALAPGAPQDAVDRLSPRELECLRWVAAGKTDKEIGIILSLSHETVKWHIDGARARFGSSTRAQAVAQLVLSGRL